MLPLFAKRPATRGATATAPKRGHVAVCSYAVPPHPETFFLLSRMLAAANRDVWVSMFIDPTYAMYFYWYWNPDVDHNLHFFPVGDWPTSSPTPDEFLQKYLAEIGDNTRKSIARAEEEIGARITYVVADAFLAGMCRGIAEERGVRWSAVWTSSAASVAAYMHADEIHRKINDSFVNVTPGVPVLPIEPSPTKNKSLPTVDHLLPGFPPGVLISDLPYGVLLNPDDSPLANMFHHMARSLPEADAVIVNSFNHLESTVTAALLRPNFHLGGLFSHTLPFPPTELRDTDGIFPWLDTHLATRPGSVVYINLASPFHTPPEEELYALAEALESTGIPFLWYQPWRVSLPEGFIERVLINSGQGKLVTNLGALPLPVTMMHFEMAVLRHEAVGAHMKRGSWRSVTESVASGKPIICRGMDKEVDHALNVALVERVWGIGVSAVEYGRMTKETAERALKRVMVEEEGRVMKEKAAALKKLAEEDAVGSSAQALSKFISLVTKS